MKELKARYKGILQMVDCGDGYIVIEDRFEYPQSLSNLYKVNYAFEPVWEAEMRPYGYKGTNDHFSKIVLVEGSTSITTFGGSTTYKIDLSSGKILDEVYTK